MRVCVCLCVCVWKYEYVGRSLESGFRGDLTSWFTNSEEALSRQWRSKGSAAEASSIGASSTNPITSTDASTFTRRVASPAAPLAPDVEKLDNQFRLLRFTLSPLAISLSLSLCQSAECFSLPQAHRCDYFRNFLTPPAFLEEVETGR